MNVRTIKGQVDLHLDDPSITDGLVYWIDRVGSEELLVSVHAPGVEVSVGAPTPQEGLEALASHFRRVAAALDKIRAELP